MKALVLALLLVALAAPENLLAQEGRIATSTDVRLTLTSVRDLRGTLMGWEADSLRIQDPASGFVSVVPSLDVIRLRIPEPRTRGRGALRGLLIGSIAGALALGIAAVATPARGGYATPRARFSFWAPRWGASRGAGSAPRPAPPGPAPAGWTSPPGGEP